MIGSVAIRMQRVRALGLGIVLAFVAGTSFPAAAAVLAYWDPAGTVDSTNPLPPTSVSPGISASNLSGGPGLTSP